MANHPSAKKRARQNEKRRMNNKVGKSRVRTMIKKLRAAITEKKKDEAQKLFVDTQGLLAKLAKTNTLKKQSASRTTSRLASQVSQI